MENQPQTPRVRNPALNQWAWPIQEVLNSKWLARVIKRDGGIDNVPWRHFVIVSGDMCLHIMATEPDVVEIVTGAAIALYCLKRDCLDSTVAGHSQAEIVKRKAVRLQAPVADIPAPG